MRVAVSLLISLCISCNSGDANVQHAGASPGAVDAVANSSLASSVWGSEAGTLTIEARGGVFEGLCTKGKIDQAIVPDDRGRFDVEGTWERAGGARADDAGMMKVRFRGTINGEEMVLAIHRNDGTNILTSTLRRGVRGKTMPCA